MDYGQIIVHVFQRATRAYYDIEHLWSDADLKFLEDILWFFIFKKYFKFQTNNIID